MRIVPLIVVLAAAVFLVLFISARFVNFTKDYGENAALEAAPGIQGVVPWPVLTAEMRRKLPRRFNLEVPFFSQAPRGDWSYPYQEACEEASCLLAANVYHDISYDVDSFEKALLELVEWEVERFGYYFHTTVAETVLMAEEYCGLTVRVHENPGLEDIAHIISRGHIIIAPFAGQLLENPYYTNGGPVYHMMVIKGYDLDSKEIITNDVGTSRGADLVYSWEIIENALHDWHDTNILEGKRLIIEVVR